MSTSVTLDVTRNARFPDRCILCGHQGPGDSLELSASPDANWRWLFRKPAARTIQVPACTTCYELMSRQRQLRRWGVVIALAAAVVLYGVLLICYRGPLLNVIRSGGLVFFLLPYFVWEAIFPLPISVTATRTSITYSFEYDVYAIEFTRLNRSPDSEPLEPSGDPCQAEPTGAASQ